MKKTAIFALTAVLLIFSLCSCAAKDNWVPAGMKLAENENADYRLYVPDDWTVDLSTGVTAAYAADRSNFTVTVFNLTGEDTYITPAEYWVRYAEDCRNTFADFQYVVEEGAEQPADADAGAKVMLGQNEALKFHCSMKVTGTEFRYTFVISIRGGYAYMLTFTSLPENEAAHTEELDKIFTNFSFEK